MLRLLSLILFPALFALGLCAIVGNAIPALIVGGISLLLAAMIAFPIIVWKDDSKEASIFFVFLGFPLLINGILLLSGSGIYYIAR